MLMTWQERKGSARPRTCSVNHVIHEHSHLVPDIADEVHDLADVVRAPALVHDSQRSVVQLLRKCPRARHAAHVWGDHNLDSTARRLTKGQVEGICVPERARSKRVIERESWGRG
jgi:hypothetical protein